jgi:hypothetical protein
MHNDLSTHERVRLLIAGRTKASLGLAVAAAVLLSTVLLIKPGLAARDPLLEVLIKKGILTPEEARQVEKEASQLEKVREQQVDQKVKAAEQKVVDQVDQKLSSVEKKVEKKTADVKIPEALKGLKVGVTAYIDYSLGSIPRPHSGSNGLNKWHLGRGYLNVQKEITPWLHVRYTPDLTQDDSGDWKLRQKYLYVEFRPPNLGRFLTEMRSELGLGHIPWLDFEEHINPYRMQGTMALERAGVLNSADLGISIRGNLGGRLAEAKTKTGSDHYDGRYGSWHIGVYNGGGYHAKENNHNKPVEYRVTLRPLPDHLPGLQLSYSGIYGKGNKGYAPDWIVHLGMLSFQHPRFILTAQTFASKGNQAGNWTTDAHKSLWTRGYSIFGDVKLPIVLLGYERLHAFFRTDWFNADEEQVVSPSARYTKLITGLACYVYKNNFFTVGYERTWYGRDYGKDKGTGYNGTSDTVASLKTNGLNLGKDHRFQVVYQINF